MTGRTSPVLAVDPVGEVDVVRIARAAGDEDLARRAASEAAARSVINPEVATLAGVAAHTRGLVEHSTADLVTAIRHFESSPRRLALASALEDCGRMFADAGQADDGAALLTRALEYCVDAGAVWDAARVRRRLRELGIRHHPAPRSQPGHGWTNLTTSESEVARLVGQGLTNDAVARRMFISANTVSFHLRRVFLKLEIHSRAELAVLVSQRDI